MCPRSDAQYALGEGVCALQHAWDHGIKPGFSVDNETSYSTDMFMEMRVALYMQRAVAQNRKFSGDQNPPKPLMVRDVLYCATTGGAHCAGLDDKIGSLAPGKEADLLMIRTDDINLYPSNNAIGTVVQAAERSNIDTVIIGGRVRKYRGRVVGPRHGEPQGDDRQVAQPPVHGGRLSPRHFRRAAPEVVLGTDGIRRP